MNESKVVLVLDREEVEALLAPTPVTETATRKKRRTAVGNLRAALQKEERVEEAARYQVVGDREGETRLLTGEMKRLSNATVLVDEAATHYPAFSNVRVQKQVTCSGPWIDLPLEEGSE